MFPNNINNNRAPAAASNSQGTNPTENQQVTGAHPIRPLLLNQEVIDPICQERLTPEEADQDLIERAPCGHLFHRHCLDRWRQESATCPIDRRSLVGEPLPQNEGGPANPVPQWAARPQANRRASPQSAAGRLARQAMAGARAQANPMAERLAGAEARRPRYQLDERREARREAARAAVQRPDWDSGRAEARSPEIEASENNQQVSTQQQAAARRNARNAAARAGVSVPSWASASRAENRNPTIERPADYQQMSSRQQADARRDARHAAERAGVPVPDWAALP